MIFNDTIILVMRFTNVDFLQSNAEYELLIENKVTGNVVSGHTELISRLWYLKMLILLVILLFISLDFYNPILADSAKFRSKLLEWVPSANGKIYQVDMIFDYIEDYDTLNPIKLTSEVNP